MRPNPPVPMKRKKPDTIKNSQPRTSEGRQEKQRQIKENAPRRTSPPTYQEIQEAAARKKAEKGKMARERILKKLKAPVRAQRPTRKKVFD